MMSKTKRRNLHPQKMNFTRHHIFLGFDVSYSVNYTVYDTLGSKGKNVKETRGKHIQGMR
uniref:Transposase n=1 Tax=Rhizophora mucronata TaxID=61149 RepID=A0A2P2IJE9_RHIMU